MTAADDERFAPLVPGAHRAIRTLTAHEGPFPGRLVTLGDETAVCVDAATRSGWDGWPFAGAEHVAAPLDVARRADGHDIFLPWCAERVGPFFARRRAAGVPLAAGEVGTLLASVLRGLRELGSSAASARGGWWLTAQGRPLFVHGQGASARDGAAEIIDILRPAITDRPLSRLVAEIAEVLSHPRIAGLDAERWERELFEHAAPRALELEVSAPERTRTLAPEWERDESSSDGAVGVSGTRRRGAAWRGRWTLAGERLRAAAQAALVWRSRARSPSPPGVGASEDAPRRASRRGLAAAGAAAVLVVLGAGLFWPASASEPSERSAGTTGAAAPTVSSVPDAGESVSPRADGSAAGDAASGPEATPATETPSDSGTSSAADTGGADGARSAPERAAAELIPAMRDCLERDDTRCVGVIADGASAALEGLITGTPTVVDEYGDIAVIRVTAETGAQQILVLVRHDDKWLVRDVYDAAHQPE